MKAVTHANIPRNHLEYCLAVLVSPQLTIFVDNLIITQTFEGINGGTHNVTCSATDAVPPALLALNVNNKTVAWSDSVDDDIQQNKPTSSNLTVAHKNTAPVDVIECYTLEVSYPLTISPVSIIIKSYTLPRVTLTFDNQRLSDVFYISGETWMNISCSLEYSISPVQLLWVVDHGANYTYGEQVFNKRNVSFDGYSMVSTMWISILTTHSKNRITCFGVWNPSETYSRNISASLVITSNRYYQPSLLIDGKNISKLDHLVAAKEREITCSPAQGVQNENTTLSVVVDFGNDEETLSSNMALNTTMTSMIVYVPGGSLWASITCIAFSMESRLWKSVLIDVYAAVQISSTKVTIGIIVIVLATIFVTFWGTFLLKKYGPIRITTRSVPSVSMSVTMSDVHDTLSTDKDVGRDTSVHKESFRSREKLPDLPMTKHSMCSNIAGQPSSEEVNYYKITGETPDSKFISREKVCFISKIADSYVYERWMGTMIGNCGVKQCVSISTPKDILERERHSWENFVKVVLEMPNFSHIAQCEGFCINNENVCLVSSYSPTEELQLLLTEKMKYTDEESTSRCLANYAHQITVAMGFLVSHGLSHPDLSTRKIGVSVWNKCQLFDFCLMEDAPTVMKSIKGQSSCDHGYHPPEIEARNEYDHYTDVWYTGVTLWEVFSKGASSREFRMAVSTKTWNNIEEFKPQSCPVSIFHLLLDCVKYEPATRADLSKLRATLTQEDMQHTEYIKGREQIEFDGQNSPYVPMRGDIKLL
ncbi:putative tyrosine kinase receptor Cad96Ca [Apostichopus japonicus]|uniref:Putative tyrosine kinase receptor Cad96Ca n=1 Tax=Stichopus japonicus TaxID=307972 RepID=A0A2G8KHU3_STIJA|nr:putative tyrosine kinase receptor Cad96Ca [Apostichopus japonicus]